MYLCTLEYLRHSKIMSAFWLCLAAMILNYSIDVPDPHNDSVQEDLSYNDMESISELVFEYFLGWDNFVPEHDDDDLDDNVSFTKKIEVTFVLKPFNFGVTEPSCIPSTQHYFIYAISESKTPFISGVDKPPQA
jgi:hypothetical protein